MTRSRSSPRVDVATAALASGMTPRTIRNAIRDGRLTDYAPAGRPPRVDLAAAAALTDGRRGARGHAAGRR